MLAEQGNESGVFTVCWVSVFLGFCKWYSLTWCLPHRDQEGLLQGTISLLLAVCTLLWVPGTAAKEQSVDNTQISISNNF